MHDHSTAIFPRQRSLATPGMEGAYAKASSQSDLALGASLGMSDLRGEMVVCNRHMWAFNVKDGSCPDVPRLKAETFEVRVVGDEIQVLLPD